MIVHFGRQKSKKWDADEEMDERNALADARRDLFAERVENTRLRAELQQLRHGVRDDEDTITP